MLRIRRSPRTDRLADALARQLADTAGLDPFAPETVVIQSSGMGRWLAHRLAERLGRDDVRGEGGGVCANVDFAFPGRFVTEVVRRCTGEEPDPDRWHPDRLVWPILDLLPGLLPAPEAAPLRTYLTEDDLVDRRRYTLCRRIADLFDRYALYRPDMVASWREGHDVDADGQALDGTDLWQPLLWRRLSSHLGEASPDQRLAATVAALRDPDHPVGGLPPRVALFNTGALPPAHLELVAALAHRSQVTLYLATPSPALWERLRDRARRAEAARPAGGTSGRAGDADPAGPAGPAAPEGSGQSASPAEAGEAVGLPVEDLDLRNPLLVSCGRLARDFQVGLAALPDDVEDGPLPGDGPAGPPSTVLELLHSDLLADRDRGAPGGQGPRHPAASDIQEARSVQLHACHGPARQVEVLRNVLLDLFTTNPDLEPRDVLVMAPDIEAYAPLVPAVFGAVRHERDGQPPPIPFQLADRSLASTNPVAEALTATLHLADGRVQASQVLDLLALDPVRTRWDLTEADLATVQGWVAATGIRWGIDAAHRADHGQPPARHHTWRFGLDRLLLGVAMADDDHRVVADVTPYDDMEGGDVELLARFATFVEALFTTLRGLRAPRPLAAWVQALTTALDDLTAPERRGEWLDREVRGTLAGVLEDAGGAGGEGAELELTLAGLTTLIEGALDEIPGWAGYETGGVTFCSLIPMRSIPHRVVCLMGMDDDAFPRAARPAGYDLLAAAPRVGDRTPRDEDRHLFLEAVLAAREHLVITYTGRDRRTNQRRAPAVPVGELLDVCDRSLTPDGDGRPARERLVTEHPLQAFSPGNFRTGGTADGSGPTSFDPSQLRAARALLEGSGTPPDFFPADLPPPPEEEAGVALGDLVRFLANPARWLLARQLGVRLDEEAVTLEDLEPVEASGLLSWRIGNARLAAVREGRDLDRWERALLARGTVPVGAPGRFEIQEVAGPADGIAEVVATHRARQPADVPVDLTVGGRRLTGLLPDVHGDLVLRSQYSRIGPHHRLRLWVEHLALTLALPDRPVRSLLVGRPPRKRKVDVEQHWLHPPTGEGPGAGPAAEGHLAALIDLYEAGRRRPVPLFPRASEAYAQAIHKGADPDRALEKATRVWEPDYHRVHGDRLDPHIRLAHGDRDLAEVARRSDFAAVSEEVWLPLLDAEERR